MLFCRNLFDRVIKERYNDGTEYHYFYDTEGNLSRQCCVQGGEVTAVYVFEYDSLGRLIRSKQTSDGTLRVDDGTVDEGTTVQRTEHLYDNENRITKQSWQLGSRTYSESYTYNDNVSTNTGPIKDGSLATMTITPLNKTLSFSYDSLKHLDKVTVPGIYVRDYDHKALTSKQSSNQVETVDYTQNGNTNFSRLYYDYTYDSAGNITKIKQNGSEIARYEYDAQGQLLKETRDGATYLFTYDTAGNILKVALSGIGTDEQYTYGNSTWKDLLTTIKIGNTTRSISYDASGNPRNWYNGNTLTNLEWSKGRQLTSLKKEIDDTTNVEISYTYDMSGIRSSKKVGSDTYHYITQNGQVVRQTWGSKILDIVYDNNGQPFALCYSTDGGENVYDYFFITNAQGDVVRLVNSAGSTVANYTYDAWGKLLSVKNASGATITDTNNIANINPIRYRGYYYDTETGWYYLQSRYYDPGLGRFINADAVELLGANGDFTSLNLFAYCGNNPVNLIDPNGDIAVSATALFFIGLGVSALISGIDAAISSYILDQNPWWGLLAGAIGGAGSFAIAETTGLPHLGRLVGSLLTNVCNDYFQWSYQSGNWNFFTFEWTENMHFGVYFNDLLMDTVLSMIYYPFPEKGVDPGFWRNAISFAADFVVDIFQTKAYYAPVLMPSSTTESPGIVANRYPRWTNPPSLEDHMRMLMF